ncbi:GntR family transcriptional regulator [Phycisphaerales bacterium AB-hyl4]|uniref:GntR family transcriptional regulator n=1 Tax=Natronomicrosphaera hydrolytica TaxID=3242702 RepID=A0ABV4U3F3_9BACT
MMKQVSKPLEHGRGVPKYLQLAAILRRDILENRLAPGEKLKSVRELANLHDSNKATVSQTMRHLASEGLVELKEKKGCFVREQSPRSAAVVFDRNIYDPNRTPYTSLLLQELEERFEEQGWICRPLLNTSPWAWEEFREALKNRQFDVVVSVSSEFDEQMLAIMRQVDIPAVGVFCLDGFDHFVDLDWFELGRRAVDALMAAGARRIGLIHGPEQFGREKGPSAGYQAGLAAQGIAFDPALVRCVSFQQSAGREAVASLLDQAAELDGLIVADELLMQGVAHELVSRPVRVPDELVVASQVSVRKDDPFIVPVIQLHHNVTQQALRLVELAVALNARKHTANSMIRIPPTIYDFGLHLHAGRQVAEGGRVNIR